MKFAFLLVIPLVLFFAGCGSSPPTHFFALTPVGSVVNSGSELAPAVQVSAVHIPALLDREELVRRTGPTSVAISDQDRWAAPLGEMAQNVLAEDLAKRLPESRVSSSDAVSSKSVAHLVVDITNFTEEADRRVELRGTWVLMKGEPPKTIVSHALNLQRRARSDSAADEAAAMSTLLGQLADGVVKTLKSEELQESSS
jgi:uncharacterized lipoprotein YmbA